MVEIVSDNLQITHSWVERAVTDTDPGPIQDLVLKMVTSGAEAIDINPGPLARAPEKRMAFLVEAVTAVTDLPILLDTTNPRAIEAGIEANHSHNQNKIIINGFSLEREKLEFILPLAVKHQLDIIGYLLDSQSHPPLILDERLAVAVELLGVLEAAGGSVDQLIIDPVLAPLIWEDGKERNRDLLRIISQLPDVFGFPVRTIVGVSNLTTGIGPSLKKRRVEQAFIPMLAAAGLSMALINVRHEESINILKTSNVLLAQDVFAWDEVPLGPWK